MRTFALLAASLLTACTFAPSTSSETHDEVAAAPGASSPVPTGRLDIDEPWTTDEPPSSSPNDDVVAPDDEEDTFSGQAAGGGRQKCGDGTCGRRETCSTCPNDCGVCPAPSLCGDGVCDASVETCTSCAGDCGACPAPPPDEPPPPPPPDEPPPPAGPVCGDAICAGLAGETCTNCADCVTTTIVCGNGACQAGETAATCAPDCGVDPWPQTSASLEDEVLRLINVQRAAGTDCPTTTQGVVPPLSADALLQKAARLHSWDQSFAGYFSHTSCNGRSPWTRAADVGTSASGETIGWGYGTPSAMVQGWMTSQGHCAILMSSRTVVGIGYADANAKLWTALFR